MVRRKQTVADFPPEFMDAWNLAAAGKLMLSMDNAGQARNMIQRLYQFRKRLMEEAPEIAAPFYLVDLRVHDEAGNVITGRATAVPGKAIIKVYSPTWKEQIRQQALEGVEVGRKEPAGGYKVENLLVPLVPAESSDNSIGGDKAVIPTSSDNLTEALSNAGYSTGEGK